MHLVIYGSDQQGHVTINGDGVRVRIQKDTEGKWVANDPRKLRELKARCGKELAEIFEIITEPESSVRPVTS